MISPWRAAPRLLRQTAACVPAAFLALSLTALSGCDSGDAPANFAPLHYEYLSRFQLNVASLQIVDNAPPGTVPGDISGRSPTPPDQALQQMAHDRLAAAGSAGTAIFSIDQASILHAPGGTLQGSMDVHLDITLPNGQHAGFAEAKVTRAYKPDDASGDADSPAALYTITTQMMNDMNVELELQVRRSLRDWLVDAGGTPVGGAIQQQTLGAPGAPDAAPPVGMVAGAPVVAGAPPATDMTNAPMSQAAQSEIAPAAPTDTAAAQQPAAPAVPAAPAAPAVPDAIFPTGAGGDSTATTAAPAPAPQQMSPKPGVLRLPSGSSTATTGSTANGY